MSEEKQTLEYLKSQAIYLVDSAQALANDYFNRKIDARAYEYERNRLRDKIAKAVYEGKL